MEALNDNKRFYGVIDLIFNRLNRIIDKFFNNLMIRSILSFFLISSIAILCTLCKNVENPMDVSKDILVLQNGLLLDGNGSTPSEKDLIIIENGYIKFVGQDPNLI